MHVIVEEGLGGFITDMSSRDSEKVEIIKLTETLADKVIQDGPNAVNPQVLERDEKIIEGLTASYLDSVKKDLANLQAAFDRLESGTGVRQEALGEVFHISHDIKGQGGTFHYNLITLIGNQLCRFVEKLDNDKIGSLELEAINVHIASMKVIIDQKITGDGDEVGEQLLSGLEKVITKWKATSAT